MRPPLWDRIKQRACRWFGHREVYGDWDVSCGRCGWLLRGPLNYTDADRVRLSSREGR